MNIIESITVVPNVIPADGSMEAIITVSVINDTTLQPEADVEVTWEMLSGVGELNTLTSTTAIDGKATTNLTSTTAGAISVKASTADDTLGKNTIVLATVPLLAPEVLNATEENDYTLNHYDIEFGVTALVPFYNGVEAGHIVNFHWGVYEEEFSITAPSELPKIIDISNKFPPEALHDGLHAVYYSVRDPAGNVSVSSELDITVDNGGQTLESLPMPSVTEADDGYINIQDALNGVDMNIIYDGVAEGDQITIYWNATDKNGMKISAASTTLQHIISEGQTSYDVVIPPELFFLGSTGVGYEGFVDAYYTVERNAIAGSLLELSFTKHCQTDTVSP